MTTVDQSPLKVFILLMERDGSNYQVQASRIRHYVNDQAAEGHRGQVYGFPEFARMNLSHKVDLAGLFKNLCASFPIFDFIFSEDFGRINNESIVIVRNNQEFLKELYDTFAKDLVDPADLASHPEKINAFVEGFAKVGYETDLLPNLINLKELLLLVVYVKRYRDLNIRERHDDSDQVFTFDEFKTLVVILNKYLLFKYRSVFDLHEETYLSNLLWYLFLGMVNNESLNVDPQMKVYNQKGDDNIFFKLNKVDWRSSSELEAGIVGNLELLYLLFANNFSSVGNPQLTIDAKSFAKAKGFEQHSEWIKSYLQTSVGKGGFNDFLDIVAKVVSIRRDNSSKESEFNRFLQQNAFDLNTQLQTNYTHIPTLREELGRKVKRLFAKYAIEGGGMYVMDFVFFAKEFGIVPGQYTNKQIMILFYQMVIRESLKKFKRRRDIFAASNLFYASQDLFVKLLVEVSENFIGGAIRLDFEEKLEVLFAKVIRV